MGEDTNDHNREWKKGCRLYTLKGKQRNIVNNFLPNKFDNLDEMDGFLEKIPMIKSDSKRNRKPEYLFKKLHSYFF